MLEDEPMAISPRRDRAPPPIPVRAAAWVAPALLALALLGASGSARAGNVLRRGPAAGPAASPTATPPALSDAARAAAIARQQASPLHRALDAIRDAQALQDAARAAARASAGGVPDGLAPGGLEIAPGTPPISAAAPVETAQGGRTEVSIVQGAERAVVTWKTFNVGPQTDVRFDQSAAGDAAPSWVVLNRIVDPGAAPSKILGSIRADGQVYVVNPNGVVFGGSSQVNVGTLVVSGLDISGATADSRNQRFLGGTLYDLSFGAPAGVAPGAVTADAGATLSASAGRVVLLGGRVLNAGSITAPDGQVILAADAPADPAGSAAITLAMAPDLTAVRGLAPPAVRAGGGTVENTGLVSAPRGNITMVAGQTLQDGVLTATTGALATGSIWLGGEGLVTRLGESSVTQVLPDTGGAKVIGSGSDFRPSRVDVRGDRIDLAAGASIYAPAGAVTLSAVMTGPRPANTTDPTVLDDTRVSLAPGARVDVSGLTDVQVPMSQNVITAELRANELADSPLLRGGPLRGQTVQFDGRLGVTVANLSGYYDLIQRDVAQLMTGGGSVTLAANHIVTGRSSVIDLSGGNLRFLDGWVKTTVLVDAAGRRVPIEAALPGVVYVGIDGEFAVDHGRWGKTDTYASGLAPSNPVFERGYVQGASAGSLLIGTNDTKWYAADPSTPATSILPRIANPSATGAVRLLDGDVIASTIVGPMQRALPTGTTDPTQVWRQQPAGANLQITGAGDVTIGQAGSPPMAAGAGAASAPLQPYQHLLPARWFDGSTFRNVSIASGYDPDLNDPNPGDLGTVDRAPGGHLVIPAGVRVNVGDRGSFSFTGKDVDVAGAIVAPGGKISLQALQLGTGETAPSVHLRSGGVLDAAGRWSNDALDGATGPLRALDGGAVSLTAASVLLDPASLVDVSGGGRLDASGRNLTSGNGGAITLDVSRYAVPSGAVPLLQQPARGTLALGGSLAGYALGTGGALGIVTGDDVVIADQMAGGAGPSYRVFTPRFFTEGGFSSYSIVGERSVTVAAGTSLAPSTQTLLVPDLLAELPSGTRLDDVAARAVLPEALRPSMTLSLSTVPVRSIPHTVAASEDFTRDLTIQPGATIRLDPGSTVRLGSAHRLEVNGTIEADGGAVMLAVNGLGTGAAGGIVLEPGSRILAPGYVDTSFFRGQPVRSVRPGGAVTLSSSAGVVVAASDGERAGAVIDVSGAGAAADLPISTASSLVPGGFRPIPVDGSAGAIHVTAAEGVIAGTLRLGAAGRGGVGGSLIVQTSRGEPMVVTQSPSRAMAIAQHDTLTVAADSVDGSGADHLTLQVQAGNVDTPFTNSAAILFDGAVSLGARQSMTLLAPVLGTTPGSASAVALSSPYVSIEGGSSVTPLVAGGAGLGSTLMVSAAVIDLSRLVVLGCIADPACAQGGFGTARLVATGDIRLSDRDAAGNAGDNPGLLSAGALRLESAQVYVTSRNQAGEALERPAGDPGFLVDSAVSVAIAGNGRAAPVPYSFGERLTIRAPSIDQGGVVRAPAGQLSLVGTGENGSVTLEPGSLTSASLEGLTVPFGPVQTGGVFFGYDQPGQAPQRSVRIGAPNIAVRTGATIDVSGGGDLLGWTFVPGNGGSKDILAAGGGFAVVPGLRTGPVPVGGVDALRDTRLQVGDRIWLQGVPGLPNGFYTLLPADYALMPGGLLVQPLSGTYASAPPTAYRPDGAVIASGYLTASGAPGFGRFVVMPQQVVRKYSELDTYSFDAFATATANEAGVVVRTPNDGGAAVLDATTTLVLQGAGRFSGGTAGLLGTLDISAPRIAVVAGPGYPPDTGYLALDPGALTGFGAGSILLGGTRTPSSAGTVVTVKATDVYVSTGGTAWSGAEIILAATGSISVADGSILRAAGDAPLDRGALLSSGDGAMLRLSSGERVPVVRTGAAAVTGTLVVGAATLATDGSLTLEGSHAIALAPAAALTERQLDVASVRVNLGDAPAGTPGVTLGTEALGGFAAGADLLIRGYDSIQLYGPLSLGSRGVAGSATIGTLTFDTGLLQGAGGPASLSAGALKLRNGGGGGQPATGVATLALDVDALQLGPGAVQIAGYGSIQGRAGVVQVVGDGSLALGGGLALATSAVRAVSGASYAISVAGDATLTRDGVVPPSALTALGARVSLDASTLRLDTSVLLPSGSFSASASGGALTVGPSAVIDVSGAAVQFHDGPQLAPGGTVRLSAAGDAVVASGAVLDASAPAEGGDAGRIQVTAGGYARLEGDFRAHAGSGALGGAFSVDAAGLTSPGGFGALDAALEAGGFDASRAFRVRAQDLTLAAGDTIHAHEVVLQADGGSVSVAGVIDAAGTASSPSGGSIRVVGGNGVSVESTAMLDARASAAPADGFASASGKVELVSTRGSVALASGAIVDVTGGRDSGGSVVMRAPATATDVAVTLDGEVRGAREVVVQGVREYQAAVVDSTLAGTLLGDAAAWLQNGGAIRSRFLQGNPGLGGVLQVGAGAAVSGPTDLTVQNDVALNGALGPGYLVLRAGRDIVVDAAVSDGFASADRAAALSSGPSSTLAFEAGRDVQLQGGSIVRTGTGDITVRAARDIVLGGAASPAGAPAVVYTAGRQTETPGFLGPPAGMPIGEFPAGGGALALDAGRDIVASQTTQSASAWLFRYGDTTWSGDRYSAVVHQQPSWSVVYRNFEQGVGALGGGDVAITAGRDVRALAVAIPTTGYLTTPPNAVASPGDLVVRGGGDLRMDVGGDLVGGTVLMGRGQAFLSAAGRVVPSDAPGDQVGLRTSAASQTLGFPDGVGLLVGLMDATATIRAGSTAYIEGAFDPARQGQIAENLAGGQVGSAFWGYTSRAALLATSLGGDVRYENDPWASVDVSLAPGANPAFQVHLSGSGPAALNDVFSRAPPTLRLTSLQSSIYLEDHFGSTSTLALAPAPAGTLELRAGQDVHLALATIKLDDIAVPYQRGPETAFTTSAGQASLGAGNDASTNFDRGFVPLHAADPSPVVVDAAAGSVCGQRSGSCTPNPRALQTQLIAPKPIAVNAGGDIVAGFYEPQNDSATDLSLFTAGRDVDQPVVWVVGPGAALVQAGRDVVLKQVDSTSVHGGDLISLGNRTDLTGTRINQALPSNRGAELHVVAGTANGVDYDAFAAAYLDPTGGSGVVRSYLPELAAYMATLGYGALPAPELVATFGRLPLGRREIFLDRVLFTELKATGIDYNDPSSPRFHSYDRGFRAIATLFPADPSRIDAARRGDILLASKPVETQANADITLLAPYGSVQVGSDIVPKGVDPASGGVVTRRGGDVRIMADGDIALYTSRVFTLQGGDVTMWTSDGSITAGAGSKTAVYQKPLVYQMSGDAIANVNSFGLQTGAGIGVLDALDDASGRPPSRLDLIAPRGEVNAGDAGIRVIGDLNIAAQVVVGVENIQTTGSATGVPRVEAPSVGVVTAASQVAQAAAKEGIGPEAATAGARSPAADLPSIITVEVVGYETTDPGEKTGGEAEDRKRKR